MVKYLETCRVSWSERIVRYRGMHAGSFVLNLYKSVSWDGKHVTSNFRWWNQE